MKNSQDMFYNIKNLRVVMVDKNYLEYEKNEYVNYFNENVVLVVEKTVINDKDKNGNPYFAEYYTECITEEDLSERVSSEPFEDNPKMFSLISRIPPKYLTEDEIKNDKISLRRIYKIVQDINMDNLEEIKVKKIKKSN